MITYRVLATGFQNLNSIKEQSFIDCANFSKCYNFKKKLIDLVSFENHGRTEHYNGKYFGEKKN